MASGLLNKFISIKDRANTIWLLVERAGQNEPLVAEIYIGQYGPHINSLIAVYSESKKQFDSFTGVALLDKVNLSEKGYSVSMSDMRKIVAPLEEIIANSQAAIGYLQRMSLVVSPDIKNRVDVLRTVIVPLENSELLHKHLSKAIDELEAAHYLASAIIAGKVTDFICSQLGGDYDKVTESLILGGVLDVKLRDNYIKGMKRARDYYTHDLKASPEPQEAVSMVSDACDFALKFRKIQP